MADLSNNVGISKVENGFILYRGNGGVTTVHTTFASLINELEKTLDAGVKP